MRKIVVKWVTTENDTLYDQEMRIIYSDHERFIAGSRFDFGFLQIANREGYIIEIYP